MAARVEHDPVRFPRRYPRPADAEMAGLLAACLAYGKAEVFLQKLEGLFAYMGPSPSAFAQEFEPERHREFFAGFVYRFNTGADLAALVSAAGRLQARGGRIGLVVAEALRAQGSLQGALAELSARLRGALDPRVERAFGPPRALSHLLPDPRRGGATKRLLLYLRWMVRGGAQDPVDLGIWTGIPTRALVIPLDTHLTRVSLRLGLTARRDASWRTAVEITEALRCLDAEDPVRFDFALCHLGMSGACPARPASASCAQCRLLPVCRH